MKRAALVLALGWAGLGGKAAAEPWDLFDWAEDAPGYWVPPAGLSYTYTPARGYYDDAPPPAPVYSGPGIYFHFGFHSR